MIEALKRHQKIIIVVVLLSFAYFLFSRSLTKRHNFTWLDRTFLWMITPAQKMVTSVVDGISHGLEKYVKLVGVVEENEKLKNQINEITFKNEELMEAAIENKRLRKLLLFREHINPPQISAEVISLDLSSQFQMFRIDRGEKDDLHPGMAVLGAGGILGQIFRTSGSFSDVLLATDRNSSMDAEVQRSGARGIIVGAGRKAFKMQFKFLSRAEDIKIGDLVVTSGLDGVFPNGLSIGYIIEVDRPEVGIFQQAQIQPTANFAKIKEVLVILKADRPELPGLKVSKNDG